MAESEMIYQILLVVIAFLTILSILPENSDKARNMLAGGGFAAAVLRFGLHYEIERIYTHVIKWDVIILIIFLTVFVDQLDELGYFEYLGIHLVKITKGDQKFLFVAFGVMMFFMSAFLDNVTAIILLSSLTITVCKRLEISPVPYLIYQTFLTGVGALMTPVGSVPNIILNSGAGIGFGRWVAVMAIYALVSLAITTIYFLRRYSDFLAKVLSDEKREELEYLDPNQVIDSMRDVYMSTVLVFLLLFGFVMAEQIHVGIEVVAVALAIITMFLTGTRSKEVWALIDWNTLFLFAGLFIVVGSLEVSGALLPVADVIGDMIVGQPFVFLFLLIIIGGLLSTALNNIPISLLITSIFAQISLTTTVGNEFWYGSVIATNIGASLTPIGSVIVIIAFEVLRKSDYEITLWRYFKATVPLYLIISILGFGYLYALVQFGLI